MSNESAEQQARDLLERCGVEDAQSFSAGDLVELANLIAELNSYRRLDDRFRRSYKHDNLLGVNREIDELKNRVSALEPCQHDQGWTPAIPPFERCNKCDNVRYVGYE